MCAEKRSNLPRPIFRPLATGVDVGEDLALLAACNHSIISYGTFGMWAALLAGGEVLPRFFISFLTTTIMSQVVTFRLPAWPLGRPMVTPLSMGLILTIAVLGVL